MNKAFFIHMPLLQAVKLQKLNVFFPSDALESSALKDVSKHSVCKYFVLFLFHLSSYTHAASNKVKIINTIFQLSPQEIYTSKPPLTPMFYARDSKIMSISETSICYLHLCSS